MQSPIGRNWAGRIALGWTLLILFVTFRPTHDDTTGTLSLCLICGGQGMSNLILNVGLFVPLGVALRWRTGSWTTVLLAGFGLSFVVEILQLWIPGRHAALADLIANTAGAGLGAWLAILPRSWLHPSPKMGRVATVAVTLLAAGVVVATGVLFTPTMPRGEGFYAQWTPQLRLPQAYPGRVLLTEIGGVPFSWGLLTERARSLLAEGASAHLRFEVGPPTEYVSPVWRLIDGGGEDAFQVGVDGEDLVIRFRYLADDVALPRPELRIVDGMGGLMPGDTLDVMVEPLAEGGHLVQTTTRGGSGLVETVGRRLGVTVARGWSLLRYPAGLPERVFAVADWIWVLALAAPLGWFAPSRLWAGVGVAAVSAAFWVTPLWTRALTTPLWAYFAFVLGVTLTRALQVWTRGIGKATPTPT